MAVFHHNERLAFQVANTDRPFARKRVPGRQCQHQFLCEQFTHFQVRVLNRMAGHREINFATALRSLPSTAQDPKRNSNASSKKPSSPSVRLSLSAPTIPTPS